MPKGNPAGYLPKKKSKKQKKLAKKLKHKKGVDNPFAVASSIMKKQS